MLHIHGVEVREFTYPKKSWLFRTWFEYVHCWFISKQIRPDIWFSLHDITPNVSCKTRIVYCQNPSPFYKLSWRDFRIEKSLLFFSLFYNLFYRINIKKNHFVVVQQNWMRNEFINRYKINNVIVAQPSIKFENQHAITANGQETYTFFYPSFPRVFKNFEQVLGAAEMLEQKNLDFKCILTFDGSENRYAKDLVDKYGHLTSVNFIGIQERENLDIIYRQASCVIFASKMETWGLPVSEAICYDKPVMVADCKYAIETIGQYNKACLFPLGDINTLASLMEKAINGQLHFTNVNYKQPPQPFARSWAELFEMILAENKDVVQKENR